MFYTQEERRWTGQFTLNKNLIKKIKNKKEKKKNLKLGYLPHPQPQPPPIQRNLPLSSSPDPSPPLPHTTSPVAWPLLLSLTPSRFRAQRSCCFVQPSQTAAPCFSLHLVQIPFAIEVHIYGEIKSCGGHRAISWPKPPLPTSAHHRCHLFPRPPHSPTAPPPMA